MGRARIRDYSCDGRGCFFNKRIQKSLGRWPASRNKPLCLADSRYYHIPRQNLLLAFHVLKETRKTPLPGCHWRWLRWRSWPVGRGLYWRLAPLPLITATSWCRLRNYNAHHPWNAVSIIGLGLLFSLELLIAPDCLAQPASRRSRLVAAAACSLLFCVAWHALDNFNKREFNVLHALVFENTPRHSLIVLADSLQP